MLAVLTFFVQMLVSSALAGLTGLGVALVLAKLMEGYTTITIPTKHNVPAVVGAISAIVLWPLIWYAM